MYAITIVCDTCGVKLPFDTRQPHLARRSARRLGWAHPTKGQDLCPLCKPKVPRQPDELREYY